MTATLNPASTLPFDAACQAILAGRPGVLWCGDLPALPAAPTAVTTDLGAFRHAAIEPWIVAEIFPDRLRWRDYARDPEQGDAFEAPLPWTASFAILQSLWDTLAAAPPAAAAPVLPVWFAYELGALLEPAVRRRGAPRTQPSGTLEPAPLAGFLIPRAWLQAAPATTPAATATTADTAATGRRLYQHFTAALRSTARPLASAPTSRHVPAPPLSPPTTNADAEHRAYLAAVEQVQAYIRAGDVYQVNVTRRRPCQCPAAPASAPDATSTASAATALAHLGTWFSAILARHPAALASFWNHIGSAPGGTASRHFLSFTPERLFAALPAPLQPHTTHAAPTSLQLLTSPIKGTRALPHEAGPAHVAALARELMHDPKELAELNMIIDMARNDLGRIARLGSVQVLSSGRIDPLPFVLHRVADVVAAADPPLNLLAVLRAVFPGASVTGAPKIRAMQIIEELEPTPRGIYCGALGWLGYGYTCDLALAIRTIEAAGTTDGGTTPSVHAQFGVGAGIVADSVPEQEWQETIAKSRGLVE